MTIRIGVIGAGIMGADHANTLHRFVSGAQVSWLADVEPARAQAVAAAIPAAVATADAAALIDADDVDAVVIASHDSTHAALIRACVAAGKPVLCEKPLAPSLAESRRLAADIGPAGQQSVALGFMRRFDPGYSDLKRAIHSGDIGAPVLVHSTGRGLSSAPGSTAESAITNSAVHDLDIVPWLLDSPVVEVSWHAPKRLPDNGFADPMIILLGTADGALATVELFLNARYGYDVRAEVVCQAGAASLVEPVRTLVDRGLSRGQSYAADWRPRFADAYRLQLQAWVDQLAGADRHPALAGFADGLTASVVADAVIESMRAGGATVAVGT